MTQTPYQEQVAMLLQQTTTSNDNAVLKQASLQLTSVLKKPESIVTLLTLAASPALAPHIRQLAAIECSKRISKAWKNVADTDKLGSG